MPNKIQLRKAFFNITTLYGCPRIIRTFCNACLRVVMVMFAAQLMTGYSNAAVTTLSCPIENSISVDFENGAGWDMCWESKARENIVLSDIHYRTADSNALRVISSLRLAQLHVTYDDNEVTFNDVTQFGLGRGHVSILVESDCPGGQLINIDDRPRLCQQLASGNAAHHTYDSSRLTEALTLFTISQVGAYAYIVTWKFFDDGSIAPSIGAAGSLQRSSDDENSPYGRALGGIEGKSWLSHTHNYYWRIDFDIGDNANDDIVSEVSYVSDDQGRRLRNVERLLEESARKTDPDKLLAWYISNAGEDITQSQGYVIEPLNYGHKLVHKDTEPYTDFDFFVSKQNDCERYISENQKFNPDCGEDILQFINEESLLDEDIVVWHRISFHHVPRNEDRFQMHSHWDGFLMRASNFSSISPGHSGIVDNSPPEIVVPAEQRNSIGETVEVNVIAHDPDGDKVEFTADGLPDGITIDDSGVMSGQIEKAGNYNVTVVVSDSVHTSKISFNWKINGSGLGAFDAIFYIALAVLLLLRHRAQSRDTSRTFIKCSLNRPKLTSQRQ